MEKNSNQEPTLLEMKDQLGRIEKKIDDLTKDIQEQRSLITSMAACIRKIMYDNSPASHTVQEKARIYVEARKRGKQAAKEAMRQLNGE